jgi:hypothetical protein
MGLLLGILSWYFRWLTRVEPDQGSRLAGFILVQAIKVYVFLVLSDFNGFGPQVILVPVRVGFCLWVHCLNRTSQVGGGAMVMHFQIRFDDLRFWSDCVLISCHWEVGFSRFWFI